MSYQLLVYSSPCRALQVLCVILLKNCSTQSVNRVSMSIVRRDLDTQASCICGETNSSGHDRPQNRSRPCRRGLASTVARNMSCRDCCRRPRALNTRSAHSSLEHDVSSSVTWSLAVSRSLMMTPSVVSCVTRCMSRHCGGKSSDFPRTLRVRKVISLDLAVFSRRLLSIVHAWM